MKAYILKRLFFTFLISAGISCIYIFVDPPKHTIDCDDYERSDSFFFIVFDLIICLGCFILSLTALFNVIPWVRQNKFLSLLTFVGSSFLVFIFLTGLFIFNKNPRETAKDFFVIGIAPLTYLITSIYFHVHFTKTQQKVRLTEQGPD